MCKLGRLLKGNVTVHLVRLKFNFMLPRIWNGKNVLPEMGIRVVPITQSEMSTCSLTEIHDYAYKAIIALVYFIFKTCDDTVRNHYSKKSSLGRDLRIAFYITLAFSAMRFYYGV